jgi:hypothetical protein
MAQTKTPQRRGASSGSSRSRSQASKGRSSRGGSSGRSRSSAQKKTGGQTARATRERPSRSANGETTVEGVTGAVSSRAQTVSSGAQNAAQGIAGFVKKAKAPLIAGGAAIAGLAGAAALNNARSRRRTVLGVTMPKGKELKKRVTMPRGKELKNLDARKIAGAVTDGAKRADRFGQRVSSVASSVQTVSETADRAAKKA